MTPSEIVQRLRVSITVLSTVIFVLLGVILLLAAPVVAYEWRYADRIFQGVQIDGIPVGGLTIPEATQKLHGYVDAIKVSGLPFQFGNRRVAIDPVVVSGEDEDISREILFFDVEGMVRAAYDIGRGGSFPVNIYEKTEALIQSTTIPLIYTLREDDLKAILRDSFGSFDRPATNARVSITASGAPIILPEQDGQVIDYAVGVTALRDALDLRGIETITLHASIQTAPIRAEDLRRHPGLVNVLAALPDLRLTDPTTQNRSWVIPQATVREWVRFEKIDDQLVIQFDSQLIRDRLVEINFEVAKPPRNAQFSVVEGKVAIFEPSMDGSEIDLDAMTADITPDSVVEQSTRPLIIKATAPTITIGDLNELGIKELLAVGESDFSGSSTARIHNIRTATERLDGIVIKPGEEFSMVNALGAIDAANGYVPEFVIKDNKTQKEYGGGLCQIGTTMFRGALRAGLPITERRNHSYIVGYYYPIGTDATIYGPHPDLRFVNDTPGHIVIQTKMIGSKLYYEFWGTSDGRAAEVTHPVPLYNVKQPPAPKLIETTELKPGVKRCSEKARVGGDTYFYRYITTVNGEKKEEIFRSHYRPWGEVCEIGVEKIPEPQPEQPIIEPS